MGEECGRRRKREKDEARRGQAMEDAILGRRIHLNHLPADDDADTDDTAINGHDFGKSVDDDNTRYRS